MGFQEFSDFLLTVKHQGGPPPLGGGRNWVHFPVYFRGALHNYLTCQTISCMYLGILGTLAVNRSMLILYGSARLLPERERLKYDLRPSLADLRPTFQQDWDLCRSSLHVGWPGGPGRSLILEQICSGLLKAPLLQGRGSLLQYLLSRLAIYTLRQKNVGFALKRSFYIS